MAAPVFASQTSYPTRRTALCDACQRSHTVFGTPQFPEPESTQHSQFLLTWFLSTGCIHSPLHEYTHANRQSPPSRQIGRNGAEWEARTSCRRQAQGMAVYTEKCIALLAVYTKQPLPSIFSNFFLLSQLWSLPSLAFGICLKIQ